MRRLGLRGLICGKSVRTMGPMPGRRARPTASSVKDQLPPVQKTRRDKAGGSEQTEAHAKRIEAD